MYKRLNYFLLAVGVFFKQGEAFGRKKEIWPLLMYRHVKFPETYLAKYYYPAPLSSTVELQNADVYILFSKKMKETRYFVSVAKLFSTGFVVLYKMPL